MSRTPDSKGWKIMARAVRGIVSEVGESHEIFDLSGLGSDLVTVLGGGAKGEDRAPFEWRRTPDFWKDMA